ncbi:MAG: porphobilinogen synthase [Gammaproteobacteria bacterium]|nr:porphobilinogen synthase [Gammaproteobacteria bacterium]MYK68146.1 porphobilinogen synthase [Gammaproteobacteria bacterium]
MAYPQHRLRRLRQSPAWRRLVRESALRVEDLVYPLFVVPGEGRRQPVPSMPGIHRFSAGLLVEEAGTAADAGVGAVLLFGVPDHKDALGSEAYAEGGLVPRTVRELKARYPDLLVWTDVCLCQYTDHGHCAILAADGSPDEEATLPLLARAAVSHARAGADAVAPSDMLDGRVGAIRAALDEAGHGSTPIVSYAAKYASGFYGPFRDAAHSAPSHGDRRTHQMDPANSDEALREVQADLEEGADIVMVKPAGPCLDVIRRVKDAFRAPTAAYQVSGEFSMMRAAGERGWIDERAVALESLGAIKRAGADIIVTYYAVEAARWLREDA